jgi:hypothetical protein
VQAGTYGHAPGTPGENASGAGVAVSFDESGMAALAGLRDIIRISRRGCKCLRKATRPFNEKDPARADQGLKYFLCELIITSFMKRK